MNLYDLMLGSGGGQGVNTLARQFGISTQQTQAALQAMVPAFSLGLQNAALDPLGFGALMGQVTNNAFAATYANPAQAMANAALGGNILSQIFGSQQMAQQIGQQAAAVAGVNPQVVQQMMPLVAAILVGGIAQSLAAQGLGNLTQEIAKAFTSGAGLAPKPTNALETLLSAWTRILSPNASAQPPANALQVGLSALDGLVQAGAQISSAQQKALTDLLQTISDASKAARA